MNVREIPARDIAAIVSEPWVDTSRKPWISGNIAYVPVRNGYPFTTILPERRRKGRGYQKIGSIIAFHGEKPGADVISEVIALHSPQAVVWYRGHTGDMRIPDLVPLYGAVTDTIHTESGIRYHLNPALVMFSQGNQEEKRRVADQIRPGERICDMFAGIGYFTLPMAKAGGIVHAIEINPVAIRYLEMNIRENSLESQVTISSGDCRDHITGIYDRIHMGHYEAVRFLDTAFDHMQTGTILHVHGIGDIQNDIRKLLDASGYTATLQHRIIKKIGPGKVHTVTDVVIT